jgi:hypothetical protein
MHGRDAVRIQENKKSALVVNAAANLNHPVQKRVLAVPSAASAVDSERVPRLSRERPFVRDVCREDRRSGGRGRKRRGAGLLRSNWRWSEARRR